jgi:hypothetical protein
MSSRDILNNRVIILPHGNNVAFAETYEIKLLLTNSIRRNIYSAFVGFYKVNMISHKFN